MSANFWSSSHCNHWLLSRQRVALAQQDDTQIVTPQELRLLRLHFITVIQKAASILQLRQQVLATAIVYFRRFYVNNSFRVCDPILVGPTCIYLACKVEECSVIQANAMIDKFKQNSNDTPFKRYPYNAEAILECEYYLLEELDCYLIVYHPYRPLTQYMSDLKLEAHLQTAWNIVNDSYHTDVCLLYPPHMTALAAMYMAVLLSDDASGPLTSSAADVAAAAAGAPAGAPAGDAAGTMTAAGVVSAFTSDAGKTSRTAELRRWFSELNVDMDEIVEITQQLLDFYAFYAFQAGNPDCGTLLEVVQRVRGPQIQGAGMPG